MLFQNFILNKFFIELFIHFIVFFCFFSFRRVQPIFPKQQENIYYIPGYFVRHVNQLISIIKDLITQDCERYLKLFLRGLKYSFFIKFISKVSSFNFSFFFFISSLECVYFYLRRKNELKWWRKRLEEN